MAGNNKTIIRVSNLSKNFKLPKEKNSSIKNLFLNPFKTRRYNIQTALKNVSFEINRGEFFGIIGRNGSGKSTLLKMLAGIYSPDQGTIEIKGKLTPFIELGVGFNPELTGRENVFLNGALLGFNRSEMRLMYPEIVKFAELDNFMDQKLKNYSSGMQVRLAFSIAIKAESSILVLDEVLAVGDLSFQEKCFEYFEEIKAKGRTVVFVSHDQKSIERFCDRVLYIKDSKVEVIGKTKDVLNLYINNLQISNLQTNMDNKSGFHVGTNEVVISYASFSKNIYSQKDIIEFNFEFNNIKLKSNQKLGLLFSLFNKDGLKVISENIETAMINKSRKFKIKFKASNLKPGVYKANIGIFDTELKKTYDQFRNCAKFTIPGDNLRGGLIEEKLTWEYKK